MGANILDILMDGIGDLVGETRPFYRVGPKLSEVAIELPGDSKFTAIRSSEI